MCPKVLFKVFRRVLPKVCPKVILHFDLLCLVTSSIFDPLLDFLSCLPISLNSAAYVVANTPRRLGNVDLTSGAP